MGHARTTSRAALVRTCNNVPVSVLHAVLVLLGRIPRCRLSLKEALKGEKAQRRIGNPLSCCLPAVTALTRQNSDGVQQKQTVSAVRAEAAGVTLKPFPSVLLLCRVDVWMPHLKVSISSSWGEK